MDTYVRHAKDRIRNTKQGKILLVKTKEEILETWKLFCSMLNLDADENKISNPLFEICDSENHQKQEFRIPCLFFNIIQDDDPQKRIITSFFSWVEIFNQLLGKIYSKSNPLEIEQKEELFHISPSGIISQMPYHHWGYYCINDSGKRPKNILDIAENTDNFFAPTLEFFQLCIIYPEIISLMNKNHMLTHVMSALHFAKGGNGRRAVALRVNNNKLAIAYPPLNITQGLQESPYITIG